MRTKTLATKTKNSSPPPAEGGSQAARLVSAFGPDASLGLAKDPLEADVNHWIDTRVPMLNYTMGIPGIPEGRLTTIKGKEGSAKSTVAYHVLAETQARGGFGILIDAEYSYDRDRGAALGLNHDELIVAYPECLEEAFNGVIEDGKEKRPGIVKRVIEKARAINADVPITIVVDSLASLAPLKATSDTGTKQPSLVARYMSDNLKLIVPQLAKARATLIIINQLRVNMSMDTSMMRRPERRKVMGEQWSMIAEQSLIYFSSLILHFTSTGITGERDNPTGVSVRVTVAKEKVGPGESKSCDFDVYKATGVDTLASKLDVLMAIEAITEKGGWYKVAGEDKGWRRSEFAEVLDAHPDLDQLVKDAPLLWSKGGPVKELDEDD